jgi:hypothetical protein
MSDRIVHPGKRQDRPVTSEVAGSSPVAPAKSCQSASSVDCVGGSTAGFSSSRAHTARESGVKSPHCPGRSRESPQKDDRPRRPAVEWSTSRVGKARNAEARQPFGHRASTATRFHGRLRLSSRNRSSFRNRHRCPRRRRLPGRVRERSDRRAARCGGSPARALVARSSVTELPADVALAWDHPAGVLAGRDNDVGPVPIVCR